MPQQRHSFSRLVPHAEPPQGEARLDLLDLEILSRGADEPVVGDPVSAPAQARDPEEWLRRRERLLVEPGDVELELAPLAQHWDREHRRLEHAVDVDLHSHAPVADRHALDDQEVVELLRELVDLVQILEVVVPGEPLALIRIARVRVDPLVAPLNDPSRAAGDRAPGSVDVDRERQRLALGKGRVVEADPVLWQALDVALDPELIDDVPRGEGLLVELRLIQDELRCQTWVDRRDRGPDLFDLVVVDHLRERQASLVHVVPEELCVGRLRDRGGVDVANLVGAGLRHPGPGGVRRLPGWRDRKSTRLNSSHGYISYAVFCLKKKTRQVTRCLRNDI